MSNDDGDDVLRQQISNLRKIRDGKVPFSSEAYRSARRAKMAKFAPLIDTPEIVSVDNKIIRRRSIALDGKTSGLREQEITDIVAKRGMSSTSEPEDVPKTPPSTDVVDDQPHITAPKRTKTPLKAETPKIQDHASSSHDIDITEDLHVNSSGHNYSEIHEEVTTMTNDILEHNRHMATVRILLETLEEQGILRALLDHTQDYQNPESPSQGVYGVDLKLRYQGAMTELEKTVQKLITARMELSDENKKRVSAEKALEISSRQLEETNAKYIAVKDELYELRKVVTLKESKQSVRPPSGSMMSSPAPPPPPLPPPEEDYNQELTYDDNEDDAYDAISFNFSDSDKNATPASLSHTRQSNKSHDIYQFNDHTSTEQSKAIITSRTNGEQMPPSPMSTQSPIKSPATSILLDIDLGDGSKGAINVTAMCNPIELAYEFVYAHGLNPDYLDPLVDYITRTMNSLSEDADDTSRKESNSLPDKDIHNSRSIQPQSASKERRDVNQSKQERTSDAIDGAKETSNSLSSSSSVSWEHDSMERGVEIGVDGVAIQLENRSQQPITKKGSDRNSTRPGKLDAVRQLLESGQIQSPEELLKYISSISTTAAEHDADSEVFLDSNDREDGRTKGRSISEAPSPPPRVRKQRGVSSGADHRAPLRQSDRPPNNSSNKSEENSKNEFYVDDESVGFEEEEFNLEEDTSQLTSPSTSRTHTPQPRYQSPPSRSSPSEESTVFNDLASSSYSSGTEKHAGESPVFRDVDGIVSPFNEVSSASRQNASRSMGSSVSDIFFNVSDDMLAEGDEYSQYENDKNRTADPINYPPMQMSRQFLDQERQQRPHLGFTERQARGNERIQHKAAKKSPESPTPLRNDDDMSSSDESDSEHRERNRVDHFDLQQVSSDEEDNTRLEKASPRSQQVSHNASTTNRDRYGDHSHSQKKPKSTMTDQGREQVGAVEVELEILDDSSDSDGSEGNDGTGEFDANSALRRMRASGSSLASRGEQRYEVRQHSPQSQRGTTSSPSSVGSRRSPQRSVYYDTQRSKSDNSVHSSPRNSRVVIDNLRERATHLDPLDVAIEVFDSATALANEGNLEDAVPLYLHALNTFEEYNYEELPMIREEIWRWVSLADQSSTHSQSTTAGLKSVMASQQQQPNYRKSEQHKDDMQPQPSHPHRHKQPQQQQEKQHEKHYAPRPRSKSPKRLNPSREQRVESKSLESKKQVHDRDRGGTSEETTTTTTILTNGASRRQHEDPYSSRRVNEARGTPQRPRRVQPHATEYDMSSRKSDRDMHISELSDGKNLSPPRASSASKLRPQSSKKLLGASSLADVRARPSQRGELKPTGRNFDML